MTEPFRQSECCLLFSLGQNDFRQSPAHLWQFLQPSDHSLVEAGLQPVIIVHEVHIWCRNPREQRVHITHCAKVRCIAYVAESTVPVAEVLSHSSCVVSGAVVSNNDSYVCVRLSLY